MKISIRKCIICGSRKPKIELIRLCVDEKQKQIAFDDTFAEFDSKVQSRGCYCCKEGDCYGKLASKKSLISRALRVDSSYTLSVIPA